MIISVTIAHPTSNQSYVKSKIHTSLDGEFFFLVFEFFIDLNKQAVIYKAKALKQIQINSKDQP